MNNNQISKGALLGATVSVVFVTVVTIVGDLYAPLKKFFADSLGHHWVGKSVWAVVIFALITIGTAYLNRNKAEDVDLSRYVKWLTRAVLAGVLLLVAFYLYEYWSH